MQQVGAKTGAEREKNDCNARRGPQPIAAQRTEEEKANHSQKQTEDKHAAAVGKDPDSESPHEGPNDYVRSERNGVRVGEVWIERATRMQRGLGQKNTFDFVAIQLRPDSMPTNEGLHVDGKRELKYTDTRNDNHRAKWYEFFSHPCKQI
jgi:hypothetical protein